jgi:hypothetical protein
MPRRKKESDDSESLRGGPGAPLRHPGAPCTESTSAATAKQAGPWWQCHRDETRNQWKWDLSLSLCRLRRDSAPNPLAPKNFARVWWGGNLGIQPPRPSNPIESARWRGHELGAGSVLHRPGGDPGLGNPYFPLAPYYALIICASECQSFLRHRAVVLHR